MAEFTPTEWAKIMAALETDGATYGLPRREYGSVLLGSFNIRKLGAKTTRTPETWGFLAEVCRSFDLLSVQEIMDDLSGLRELMRLLGPEFGLVVSDQTGAFPGEGGSGERLGFIYRWSAVERGEVASDITYDRTKVLGTIAESYDAFAAVMEPYAKELAEFRQGILSKKPKIKMPFFLTFIRQPFCVSFRIRGLPGTAPYEFMAVNAHLNFGNYISDRRQAFEGLMDWIIGRVGAAHRAYHPNFILLGDLNLDFNNPTTDRARLEDRLKSFDNSLGERVNVYFPFLDPHPPRQVPFKTNARMTETYDQIGLFSRDDRLPTFLDNPCMGKHPRGPDYGVFEFVDLFSQVLRGKLWGSLTSTEQKSFVRRFQFEVSDHMPLWVRLRLPER